MSAREVLQKHFGGLGISGGGQETDPDVPETVEEPTEDFSLEEGEEALEDGDPIEGEEDDTDTDTDEPTEEPVSDGQMTPEEKAKLLDRLLSEPEFREAFMASMGTKKPEQQTQHDPLTFNPFEGVNPSDVLEEEAIPAVKATVWQVLQEYLFPDLQQYKQVIVQLAQGQQENRFTKLEQKYPDAASKRQEIAALVQANPNLSLEQAYFAAAGPSAAAPKPAPKRKKKVSLTKSGSVPASKVRTRSGARSMADIVREEFEKAGLQ